MLVVAWDTCLCVCFNRCADVKVVVVEIRFLDYLPFSDLVNNGQEWP